MARTLPKMVLAIARAVAEEEIGNAPPQKCFGDKARRYNAAFNGAVKAMRRRDAQLRRARKARR